MKLLEEKIRRDGKFLPGGVLKVDNFLNHQLDPQLLFEMGKEIQRLFDGCGVNKILTVESSGIAIAVMAGYAMGCPVVFAKKSKTRNISDNVWRAEVVSFTHGTTNTVMVSKEYLGAGDRVLIIDDFLATGAALVGLTEVCRQAGAEIVGMCAAIEKQFQGGGDKMREQGFRVESLAKISSISDDGRIEFC